MLCQVEHLPLWLFVDVIPEMLEAFVLQSAAKQGEGEMPDDQRHCFILMSFDDFLQTRVKPRGGVHLHIAAFELTRGPDGGWWVLGQRTQAPSGLGYLLENRLIIAQQFVPTDFDWRVTVLDRRPLFVCRYFMAPGHWQIHKHEPGRHSEGATQALSVGEAPEPVVKTAVRAANLVGNGLYGVDLKQTGGECLVMEINDNPNIEAGNEDQVLQDALYRELMGVFLRRITERRQAAAA